MFLLIVKFCFTSFPLDGIEILSYKQTFTIGIFLSFLLDNLINMISENNYDEKTERRMLMNSNSDMIHSFIEKSSSMFFFSENLPLLGNPSSINKVETNSFGSIMP